MANRLGSSRGAAGSPPGRRRAPSTPASGAGQASAGLGVEDGEPYLPAPPYRSVTVGADHPAARARGSRRRRQPLQNVEGKWLGEGERLGRLALGRGRGRSRCWMASRGPPAATGSPSQRHTRPAPQGAGTSRSRPARGGRARCPGQPAQLVTLRGVQVAVERLARSASTRSGRGVGARSQPMALLRSTTGRKGLAVERAVSSRDAV